MALEEWLTDTVGKKTWAQAGDVNVFDKILSFIMGFKEGAVELLHEWWSSALVIYQLLTVKLTYCV